jgi:hypothetical protein
LTKTTVSFFPENLIITLVIEKNDNCFAKNCQQSQKIVIITSTPVLKIKVVYIKSGQHVGGGSQFVCRKRHGSSGKSSKQVDHLVNPVFSIQNRVFSTG